jgi:hypothetical protein
MRMKLLLNFYLIAKRTTKPITINLPSPPIGSDLTETALAVGQQIKGYKLMDPVATRYKHNKSLNKAKTTDYRLMRVNLMLLLKKSICY